MKFQTERLFIRAIAMQDAEEIFLYRNDAEANKYQGWIPKTLDEVKNFIAKNPEEINKEETWFQLVILNKESNTLIGDIGLHFIGPQNFQVELGCTLNKSFQGKGYATEALQIVINFLFKDLQKHRLIASIDPENIASAQLFERLGFRKEAHFKQSYYFNGRWLDDVVYAKLRKEG